MHEIAPVIFAGHDIPLPIYYLSRSTLSNFLLEGVQLFHMLLNVHISHLGQGVAKKSY